MGSEMCIRDSPRTGELRPGEAGASPIFPGGKAPAGSWSRTPRWRGCPRAPWNTNRHLRAQETAPYPTSSTLKDCRAHSWTQSSIEGLGWWLHMEGAVRPGLGVGSGRGRGSLQRGLWGSGTSSEGLGQWHCGDSCVAGRGNPTAQALEHSVPGHSPGSGLPLGQVEPGKAHDS